MTGAENLLAPAWLKLEALHLTLFCKLHFRAVERLRFVILNDSLLSPSTDHAQKFKGRIKKDASSMTIPASLASFRSLYKKCQVVKAQSSRNNMKNISPESKVFP